MDVGTRRPQILDIWNLLEGSHIFNGRWNQETSDIGFLGMLFMIKILHDFICQNPTSHGILYNLICINILHIFGIWTFSEGDLSGRDPRTPLGWRPPAAAGYDSRGPPDAGVP